MTVGAAKRFQLYLLLFVMARVYLPSVFGEFTNIDDNQMVDGLRYLTSLDLSSLFSGQLGNGLYYRPLLILTFHLEAIFLAVDPMVMRLDNVLLHIANTLLVYFIICKIHSSGRNERSGWPLLWALLYGLHPLATESVNWVSGRTDLLAGLFSLAATCAVLRLRDKGSLPASLSLLFFAICAVLSKEVAISLVPGLVLLLSSGKANDFNVRPLRSAFVRLFALVSCAAIALIMFIQLRALLITSSMGGIGRTLKTLATDQEYAAMLFARLFGFYSKKIVWPWPLNFAIDAVDPVYDLLGLLVIAILILLFLRNSLTGNFFIVAGLLVLPAYPVSFGQVAWMPYAERYALLALAFVIFGLASFLKNVSPGKVSSSVVAVCLLTYVTCSGWMTYQRNNIWQSNVTLWAETVKQSPDAPEVRTNYGVSLYRAGNYSAAEEQFLIAKSGKDYNYLPKNGIRYGKFLAVTGKRAEAIAEWRSVVENTKGKSKDALQEIVTLCSRSPRMTEMCGGSPVVAEETRQLILLDDDPMWQSILSDMQTSMETKSTRL